MSARKIFAAILLAVMAASGSFADVTPKQVLRDPRFYPHVEATREKGADFLPGRYVCTKELPSRTDGQEILAPTNTIIEIGKFDSTINAYPFISDTHGGKQSEGRITLDTESEAPVLTYYTKNDAGEYEIAGKSYAALTLSESDYGWLTGRVSDGEITCLIPANEVYYPEGWYLGAWKCRDGTQFTFEGNKASSGGHEVGTFTVSDNRITVTASDGSSDTIYALWNPYRNVLVMTFTSGPDGMGMNAGSFERMEISPKPVPETEAEHEPKPSEPQMPEEFPPMPDVKMPPQDINIDGVWGAYYDGHQLITQFQGSNYYGWIDGQPSEMGIIRVEGSTITGSNNKGVDFTAELELDGTGKLLSKKFPNGNVIHYQRLQ